jgi:hypothetical protein
MGEKVVKTSFFPSGALRDLSNPHNGGTSLSDPGWQPAHLNEKYTGTRDNGGVHINSGIPNFAFYKFATFVGRPVAGKVFYKALSSYLTRNSDFKDFSNAVKQAAQDEFPSDPNVLNAAQQALADVGLDNPPVTKPTPGAIKPVNGPDYVLILNEDKSYTNGTLSVVDFNGAASDISPLTNLPVITRPSVSDDGSKLFFVNAADSNIVLFNLNTAAPSGQLLTTNGLWSSVSISPDGKRLAATSVYADTTIYLFDLTQPGSTPYSFTLYAPADTTNARGPVYADAITFDPSGQWVYFDALNRMTKTLNGQSQTIEYWNSGRIRVWNTTTNTVGDGEVEDIIGLLPDNVSINNPSPAKNAYDVVAFDYYDETAQTNRVVGLNVYLGGANSQKTIVTNGNTLGYPSYSRLDNRVAYRTYNTSDQTYNINSIAIDTTDRVTVPSGSNPVTNRSKAEFPIWFSVGTRALWDQLSAYFSAEPSLTLYPNPTTTGNLTLKTVAPLATPVEVRILDVYGRHVLSTTIPNPDAANLLTTSLNVGHLAPGTYFLTARFGGATKTAKFIRN